MSRSCMIERRSLRARRPAIHPRNWLVEHYARLRALLPQTKEKDRLIDPNLVAGFELMRANPDPIHIRTVSAVEIGDHPRAVLMANFGVVARGSRRGDDDIAIGMASELDPECNVVIPTRS